MSGALKKTEDDGKPIMLTRRNLAALGATALAGNALSIASAAAASSGGKLDSEIARDEDFWAIIARAYRLDGRHIVLNGGGNNPLPATVVDALNRFDQMTATQPRPHNYAFQARIDDHRVRLARLFDCAPEELAINRNTTEGLNIVGWGLPLSVGDEIIISNFDDVYAVPIFQQRAARHGVVLKEITLPLAPGGEDVVAAFRAAMSSRTKLLVASHLVDGWGFVLPIRALSTLAHEAGAQMLADGALSFGQFPVSMKDLGCDYYATSLHKWLNAPLGTGALFVRRDRIESLWPLYGVQADAGDIRKFEEIGTRSGPTLAAIGQAIDFYEEVGPARKHARVRYLLELVIAGLKNVDRVKVVTERDARLRTGLARVMIDGVLGKEFAAALHRDHQIFTFGGFPGPHQGVYISPNIFNSADDMGRFVEAVKSIAAAPPLPEKPT